MQAARGDAEHHVAGRDRRAVEHFRSLDDADAKAGQIVVARAYISGMIAVSPPIRAMSLSTQPSLMPLDDLLPAAAGSSCDIAT